MIDEADLAVAYEAFDLHFKGRLVGGFPGDFASFLCDLFGGGRFSLPMEIIGVEPRETEIADQNLLNLRAIFDRKARRRQRSRPDRKLISFRDRFEIIQGYLVQLKVPFERDMRFGEKICMALKFCASLIKDDSV